MLHRGQQLSAATARNVLAITEWRLSARSAGSDDVLDDSQPSDRADQAATSRDSMSQLCMSLEGPPSWHVHHGNAHRLDTTCKCESPTTSLDICLASSRPLHTPPPPLPLPRTPCTHTQTAAHENDLKPPRGGPTGGEAPSGATPPPATPNLPPQPEHTLLAGQSSRRSGGGRGDCHAAPGLANGSGTSLFQPRAVGSSTRSKVPLPIIQAESRIRHAIQHALPSLGSRALGKLGKGWRVTGNS